MKDLPSFSRFAADGTPLVSSPAAIRAALALAQSFVADRPCALVDVKARSCLELELREGAVDADQLCGECVLAWRIRQALDEAGKLK